MPGDTETSGRRLRNLIVGGLFFYPIALGGLFLTLSATDVMIGFLIATLVITWWAATQVHMHWCNKPVASTTPDATQSELPF